MLVNIKNFHLISTKFFLLNNLEKLIIAFLYLKESHSCQLHYYQI